MNTLNATGYVQSVTMREYPRNDGTTGRRAILVYNIRDRVRTEGEYKTQTVMWCQSVAFDQTAEFWERNITPGKVIEITGSIARVEHWTNDNTGKSGITVHVAGFNGGATPQINRVPKEWVSKEDEENKSDQKSDKANLENF